MLRRQLLVSSGMGAAGLAMYRVARAQQGRERGADGSRTVREFGAIGDGRTDDTAAFRRAIDFVHAEFDISRDTSHLPCIVLPAGRYVLTDSLSLKPWIKLRTEGSVLLDFTRLPADRDGIICRNEIDVPVDDLRYPGNRSPFLDGSGGTLSILGPGKTRSNGWAIVMGNFDARHSGAVRDAGGCNVVVSNWRGALRIDPVNAYLNAWSHCRFEQNRETAVYVASNSGLLRNRSVNSGERMTFFDCTFAGSDRAISIDSDSQDFVFEACSFDFNGDALRFGPNARYGTIALNQCHIEGFDRLLVDARAAGESLRVAMDHCIVLPRCWKQRDRTKAPRRLVEGNVRFAATSVEFRFEAPLQDANETLIADNVRVEALSALSFPGYVGPISRSHVLNADSAFMSNDAGTATNGLKHWTVSTSGVADSRVRLNASVSAPGSGDVHDESRCLLFIATGGGANTTIEAKSTFSVEPGAAICASCACKMGSIGSSLQITFEFLSGSGVSLSRASASARAGDPAAPVLQALVPPGASQARLSASYFGWSGQLQIRSLFAWRVS